MATSAQTDSSFGPADFTGWPEVPPAERLERAIFHVRDNINAMMAAGEITGSGDPALDEDIALCATSMQNSALGQRILPAALMRFADDGELTTLVDILSQYDDPESFAAAIIVDDTPDTPGHAPLIGIQNIFALLRQDGWMGLSPHLESLQGSHLHAVESHAHPGSIAAFLAVPPVLMTPDVPPPGPVPEGEPARLRDIALWHGALTFHWIPAPR